MRAPLRPNVVQVWTARLDEDVPPPGTLAAVLDADETARAGRFHFEHDRRHFAATRGILRLLLGGYLQRPAREICFDYGPRGKPCVARPEAGAVRFNVSHSHGRALFAFALAREVGVDVEAGARLKDDWMSLARRVFSPAEQRELATLPTIQQRAGFLDGWTRKEAYLKATGLGIVDGLQSIEVTLDPARPCALLAGPAGTDWSLCDLRVDDGFAAALVVQGKTAYQVERFDYTA